MVPKNYKGDYSLKEGHCPWDIFDRYSGKEQDLADDCVSSNSWCCKKKTLKLLPGADPPSSSEHSCKHVSLQFKHKIQNGNCTESQLPKGFYEEYGKNYSKWTDGPCPDEFKEHASALSH